MDIALETRARSALAHGGAALAKVDTSADLSAIVDSLIKGGFYHAGQVSVSVLRVYVLESGREELAARLADGAMARR